MSLQHIRNTKLTTQQKELRNFNKKSFVLHMCLVTLTTCKNHIERLSICQQLADHNKQPMRFMSKKHYYYLFSCGTIDLKYEDTGEKWTLELV